jgi:hypothetical protein
MTVSTRKEIQNIKNENLFGLVCNDQYRAQKHYCELTSNSVTQLKQQSISIHIEDKLNFIADPDLDSVINQKTASRVFVSLAFCSIQRHHSEID